MMRHRTILPWWTTKSWTIRVALGCMGWIALNDCSTEMLRADTIALKKGGILSGTILPTKSDEFVVIRTGDGVTMQIEKSQILKDQKTSDREAEYVKSLKDRPDTAESNREIARECQERAQVELSRAHLERLVELDPNDAGAWRQQGYMYDDGLGRWLRKDAFFARRGQVQDKGGTSTIHAEALVRAKREALEAKAKIGKEVANAFKNRTMPGNRGLQAQEYLQKLNDPLAIDKVQELLVETVKNGGSGQLHFEILLRMPGQSATGAFIALARNLEVPNIVVQKSLEALMRDPTSRDIAMVAFVSDLKPPAKGNPNIAYIDRAGSNLETIGDERVIPSLIFALTNKSRIALAPQNTTSFDKNTGAVQQMSGGGGARIAEVENKQAGVLAALSQLTGESYGYDKNAWLDWFATQNARTNLSLRRFE